MIFLSLISPKMASFQFPNHLLTFLCFSLATVSIASTRGVLEAVGVYWDQNNDQNSLRDACNSGNYQIINIVFQISLDNDTQTPEINLTDHCNSTTDSCTKFTQEIKSCQALGIKILLSIGGGSSKYNLNNYTEATNFAVYLWNNFLGGQSNPDAEFDGVDITNERRNSWDEWSKLAEELEKLYKKQGKKFYLSAAAQCSSVEDGSPSSIPEPGLFDYISVQYYGDDNVICQYGNGFWENWNMWKTFLADKVFVGLLPAPLSKGLGYIAPEVLRTQVLPELRRSEKFGGVMLASVGLDEGYSSKINPKVCGAKSQSENDMATSPMGNNYGGQRGFRSCGGTCVIA